MIIYLIDGTYELLTVTVISCRTMKPDIFKIRFMINERCCRLWHVLYDY